MTRNSSSADPNHSTSGIRSIWCRRVSSWWQDHAGLHRAADQGIRERPVRGRHRLSDRSPGDQNASGIAIHPYLCFVRCGPSMRQLMPLTPNWAFCVMTSRVSQGASVSAH